MSIKRYQNELIVLFTFLLMFATFMFKHNKVVSQESSSQGIEQSLGELKELINLKKIWSDTKTTKKVEKLKTLVSPSKIRWRKEGKKVNAIFKNLSSHELNILITKLLNTAVVIQKLNIQKLGTMYNVECKCKW